jgi:MoxR-like ATPase
LPQASASNQPPTQNLSSIAEGLEHTAFDDIPKVELQHATNNNGSTAATGSSQHVGGSSSTQTNEGAPHQSPSWAPSPIQVIQEHTVLEQLQLEDWEDEASEDEVEEEAELARVQQDIKRLCQEQEGKLHLSVSKLEGNTSIEKEQGS